MSSKLIFFLLLFLKPFSIIYLVLQESHYHGITESNSSSWVHDSAEGSICYRKGDGLVFRLLEPFLLSRTASYGLSRNISTYIGTQWVDKAESMTVAARTGSFYPAELLLGILRTYRLNLLILGKKRKKEKGCWLWLRIQITIIFPLII